MRPVLLALVVTATACGTTTRFTPTNPSPRPLQPRAPQEVSVFTSGPPQEPYTEIGIIQARQSSEFSIDELPEIINEMRAKAAQIGCDGVIVNGTSNKTQTSSFGHKPNVHTLEGFWGACIVYAWPAR